MTRLDFLAPPYGFTSTAFELVAVGGSDGLAALREAAGSARLFVLEAARHLPSYRPELPAIDVEELGGREGLALYLVVNPSGEAITVNLAAPILVAADGRARQVILDRGGWPMRMPLAEVLAAA
ncbi:flagellar assembly protein FliW [Agromyces sp. G08B096]|uniref:Flagellar assembly protein FliW n=1 Tax=Agromyces sp. G08B096 TaxID=3156399 RepID=A0AAU7W967_9MICO